MTKKEKAILTEMRDEAYARYFDLKNTKDEDLKNGPGYPALLDKYLSVACEYIELIKRLEQGA